MKARCWMVWGLAGSPAGRHAARTLRAEGRGRRHAAVEGCQARTLRGFTHIATDRDGRHRRIWAAFPHSKDGIRVALAIPRDRSTPEKGGARRRRLDPGACESWRKEPYSSSSGRF